MKPPHCAEENASIARFAHAQSGKHSAQLSLFVGGHHITSIITTDEALKLRLKKGQTAIALVKSTDVTIMPLD